MSKKKKIIIFSLALISTVVTVAVIFGLWFYLSSFSSLKLKLGAGLHLPVALAGGNIITANELEWELYRMGGLSSENLDKFQEIISLNTIAKGKVTATDEDIKSARESVFSIDQNYKTAERKFGSAGADKIYVWPYVLENKLATWYSSQTSLEPEMHDTATFILASLQNNSSSWDSLAEKYSLEDYSKSYGGDSGLIDINKSIPEFKEQVLKLDLNKPSLVFTRYGIHIVEVIEKVNTENEEFFHLREILLKPTRFSTWLENELKTQETSWWIKV